MKTCPKCKHTKNDVHFYVRNGKASGYCKPCCYEVQRDWAEKNRTRKLEINRNWRVSNPERRSLSLNATNKLWAAIKAGHIVRGTVCSKCGDTNGIEAAHETYDNPLNVTWLCRKCHRTWDANSPKTKKFSDTPYD